MVIYVGGIEHRVRLGDLPLGVKEWIGKPMPTRDQIFQAELPTPPPMQPAPLEMPNTSIPPPSAEILQGENSNGIPIQAEIPQPFKEKSPIPPAGENTSIPVSTSYNKVPPPPAPSVNPVPKIDISNIDFALLANLLNKDKDKSGNNSGSSIPGLDATPSPTPAATGSKVAEKPTKRGKDEVKEEDSNKENTETAEPKPKKIKWENHAKIKKINPVMLETRHNTLKE